MHSDTPDDETVHFTCPFLLPALWVCSLFLLSALTGCTRPYAKPAHAMLFELTPQEHNMAKSLAHYGQGLINEEAHGENSVPTIREYTKAAELSHGNITVYLKLADICVASGLRAKAIQILHETIELTPESFAARLKLASLYQLNGDFQSAARHYIAAIAIDPSQTRAYAAAARVLFHSERDRDALALLERGLGTAAQPEQLLSICHTQGMFFKNRGEYERAIQCLLLQARYSRDNRSDIYGWIGLLHEALGHQEEAEMNYRKATQDEPPAPESFIHLARAQLSEEDTDTAIQTLREGVRRLPESMMLLMALANTCALLNQYTEAIDVYEHISTQIQRAAGVPPDHFYLRYGATCDQAGLISRATEVFERGLQHYPDDHQVLNYLAYMWAEHGVNLDKAMAYVDRALLHEPQSPAYLDTRGWIHFKNGNYRAALEDITLACSLLPNDATITDHLGDTWRALGNLNKALAYWKDSYRVDSGNSIVAEKLQANGINLGEISPLSSIVGEAQQTAENETPVADREKPDPQIGIPTQD